MASANRNLSNPIHHSRFLRYKSGLNAEEIAKQDGVAADTVMASVRMVEMQEHLYSASRLERTTIQTIAACEDVEREALKKALKAEVVLRDPESLEKLGTEPDHDTRLAAVEQLNDMRKHVFDRHKAVPGAPGVNVGVAVNVGSGSSGHGHSFEERLRNVTARRQGQLPAGKPELTEGKPNVIDVVDDAAPQERPAP